MVMNKIERWKIENNKLPLTFFDQEHRSVYIRVQ